MNVYKYLGPMCVSDLWFVARAQWACMKSWVFLFLPRVIWLKWEFEILLKDTSVGNVEAMQRYAQDSVPLFIPYKRDVEMCDVS